MFVQGYSAVAPISTVVEMLAVGYLARIANPAKVVVDVSLDDGDIYAIVFGLLILVVGHVMYEAVKLFDENKSFV